MAERFTGPYRECMEWLGEMGPSADDLHGSLTGCTARALESEHFQELACTAVCESTSRRYINCLTDRRTLYRTRKFSEVRSGTLGPKRAREGPIIPQYDSVGKGLRKYNVVKTGFSSAERGGVGVFEFFVLAVLSELGVE